VVLGMMTQATVTLWHVASLVSGREKRTKACVMGGGTLGSVASVVAERLIDKDL
jgi:hypothetical protein